MLETEIAVVGAGPAGLTAACAAREAGAKVTVLDDQASPGGQLFKQIHKFFGSKAHLSGTRGFRIGQQLLARARDLGVDIMLDTKVIGIFEDSVLGVICNGRMDQLKARKIVIATGADENRIAFPGWTLPGVMTAGAAQTLTNIHRVLPGRRVLMVGSGNVGLIVSFQLLQAGADCVAVVEALPKIGGYWVHAAKLVRAGVPVLTRHTIREVRGREQVEEAVIVQLDGNGKPQPGTERTFQVDTVCLAVGLSPSLQLTNMAGCAHRWDQARGGYVSIHDENYETTVPGIYVAGDVAGVEEASTAMEQGRIAGLSAVHSLGYRSAVEFELLHEKACANLNALRRPSNADGAECRIEEWRLRVAEKGVFSPADLKGLPGVPSEERMRRGPVAVIECGQQIPCNPCETNCHLGAVSLAGGCLTGLPALMEERCTGCGLCVAKCPGQAIFVVDLNFAEGVATVSFPYEFLPLPRSGDEVQGTDREGKPVVSARVIKVDTRSKDDRTAVVTIAVPVEYAHVVRGIAGRKECTVFGKEQEAGV